MTIDKNAFGNNSPQGELQFWRQIEKGFADRMHELEKIIAEDGSRELDVMERAGVPRKWMLRLVAITVDEEGAKGWTDLARSRRNKLKKMATRLKSLSLEAEELSKDPFCKPEAYIVLGALGNAFGINWPEPLWKSPEVQNVILGMEYLANYWLQDAGKLGRLLRSYGDKRINLGIPFALCKLCLLLKINEPINWNEIAILLTDGYHACKKTRSVSSDSLRKIWKKYGKRMLQSFRIKR